MNEPAVSPFVKWIGGKRWLGSLLKASVLVRGCYYEPFLGSGAPFFSMLPSQAILSDRNIDLIATFNAIKRLPISVSERLSKLNIDSQTFQRVRLGSPTGFVDRAVRMIYLNRAAFNGVYRVNQKGVFNVPFGCKPGTRFPEAEHLLRCSAALRGASILCRDFEDALQTFAAGDTVYADPPYTAMHCNGSFRRYNEKLFSWEDQRRLASRLMKLAKNDGFVVASNAYSADLLKLYPCRHFDYIVLDRASNLSANAAGRGRAKEVVLFSKNLRDDFSAALFMRGYEDGSLVRAQ